MTVPMKAPPSTFLHGRRTSWATAPAAVRRWVEARLDGPVVTWEDRVGGMSVGIAAVLTSRSGRSLFVKAVNGTENPFAVELATRESELAARLPSLPHTVRVLDAGPIVAGSESWWAMAMSTAAGPTVRHPWRPADLTRVLAAWDEVAAVLHPTPWQSHARPAPYFTAWSALEADPDDPWHPLVSSWLDREARLVELVDGSADDPPVLCHLDLRADNILLDPGSAEVTFVDWAHAALSARWLDVALLLTDVVGSGADATGGGPIDVVDVWRRHPIGRHYDPELLICVIAGVGAALHRLSRRPTDLLLPHRNRWGAAMADGLLPFLREHQLLREHQR